MVCAGLLFGVVIFERLVRALLRRRLQRLEAAGEKDGWVYLALETLHKPLTLFIWVYGVYAALSPLFGHFQSPDGTNLVHTVASRTADVGGTIVLIWVIYRLVAVVDVRLKQWASTTESTIDDMLVPLVGKTLRIFVAAVGAIMVLQTLTGIDVGPLIASLGIGGLALALAAKESVANFFGTLTILFDKPFQVGERILVDGYDGIVESVGFRSIRLRTLTGHLVTVPNEKVVNSPIENVGKRPHIRWLTNITITYDTPPEKVERAVEIIRTLLENHEGMHPDFPPRVVFNGFNDWSLNIMVIAWYHPPDYWAYQAWLQKTCLAILKAFNEEGIEFAFPTRTLYLANDDRRQLKLRMLQGETS
ncbi:MAG: mechanosensitive ion channel family protein [Desulfacinum sp.]|nr:mechanosensitive ion channel family protein [Desulfacinum sp.]